MDNKKLPFQIPIFPLTGAILLPKGHLPLNIFEPRYKKMIEMAHDGHGVIGMVQPQNSNISNSTFKNDLFGTAPRGRNLYGVGCVGLITEMEKTDEDQYFVVLTGLKRFSIVEELPMKNLFREVTVSYNDFSGDGDEAFSASTQNRARFLDTLNKYLTRLKINIDVKSLDQVEDEELINSMAMICPFDAAEKQLLLEISTLSDRAELMIKIMNFNLTKHDIILEPNIH